ncbi:MAG: hypothetical protein NZ742_01330 [Acidobacteria bacterium]|nr:hypothetical protein [Acidobacteriota bacterium]MDW7983502.1 hypothetical protein [Acidobacteriota bacterium]
MPAEVWWGIAAFGFFLVLWAVLPSRLKKDVWDKIHLHGHHASPTTPSPAHKTGHEVVVPARTPMPSRRSRVRSDDTRTGAFLESVTGHRGNGVPRYVVRGTFDGFAFALPVHCELYRDGGLLCERFHIELFGFRLTCRQLADLPEMVLDVLAEVAYGGRLPRFAFRTRSGPTVVWPVYPWERAWRILEPEGPILEAGDLGTLWLRLAHYLGVSMEDLEVLRLTTELRWATPIGVLRSVADEYLRVPVYAEGSVPWATVGGRDLTAAPAGEDAWLAFLEHVESALQMSDGLVLTGLPESLWQRIAGGLTSLPSALRYYETRQGRLVNTTIRVFCNSRAYVAACPEGGSAYALYAAPDLASLRHRVATNLWRRGRLTHPDHLRWASAGLGPG